MVKPNKNRQRRRAARRNKQAANSNQQQPKKQVVRVRVERERSCVFEYYRTLNDPWTAPPACIPTWPSRPSMKARTFARGTWATNSSGSGFIMVNPFSMVCSSSGAANQPNLSILTNSATAVSLWDISTGTNTTFPTNTVGQSHFAAFSSLSVVGQGLYRLVSAGIRIRYIDALLSRSGRYVSYRCDGDSSAAYQSSGNGTLSFSSIANVRQANYGTVTSDWVTVLYEPQDRDKLDFHDMTLVPSTPSEWYPATPQSCLYLADASPCLVVVLDSTDSARRFEYEVTANFEIVGGLATAPSASDVDGSENFSFATRTISLQRNQSTVQSPGVAQQMFENIKPTLVDQGSRFAGFLTALGVRRAANYVANQVGGHGLERIEL